MVKSALKFTSHAPFINPSLASPDLVAVEKDHLIWPETKMKAVFFTTGCVSACNLVDPAQGHNNSPAVKKLLLFPITGIFQEALDFFGFKFKVGQAAGQIVNGMVAYSTKKEGHAVYSSSTGKLVSSIEMLRYSIFLTAVIGSPKKKNLFKKPTSQHTAPSGSTFPVSLAFTDDGGFI